VVVHFQAATNQAEERCLRGLQDATMNYIGPTCSLSEIAIRPLDGC